MNSSDYSMSIDELETIVRNRPLVRNEKIYFEAAFPMIHMSLWGDLMSDMLRTVADVLGDDYITKWTKTSNWIGKEKTVRKTLFSQETESLPAELLADGADDFSFEAFAKSDRVVKKGIGKRRKAEEVKSFS